MQKQEPWPVQNDPHKFLALIGSGRSTSDYKKDADIFVQGTVADSIFYIQHGRVKATVISERGKEATVAVLERRAIFRRSLSQRPSPSDGHDDGDDRLPHNRH